jgi:hypothetical protein
MDSRQPAPRKSQLRHRVDAVPRRLMNNIQRFDRFRQQALRVAAAGLLAAAAAAQATTVQPGLGQWVAFDVDEQTAASSGLEWIDISDGSLLSFSFSIATPTWLRVVDAGYAGDSFNVQVNGQTWSTSDVGGGSVGSAPNVGVNFDAAWANPAYSRGAWLLSAPGDYTVTGSLLHSVGLDGTPLNATVGAVMLAPVPEPAAWALMLAGLAAVGVVARRRRSNAAA